MSDFPAISIIGPGKVGIAIGVLAARVGYPVVAVGGRDKERAVKAARRIGKHVRACTISEAAQCANLIFITVTDGAIEQVCCEIANQGAFNQRSIVAHCSGTLSSDVLSSARNACQCSVASMHPLQTFPTIDSAVKRLEDTYCFYEGDEDSLPVIENLAIRIGLKPTQISISSKVLYHTAAVFACNYLIALMDAAMELTQLVQIDRSIAWSAFEPLVVSTIKNIAETGTSGALTGPIARGDIETIAGHIEKLELVEPSLASVYRTMGCYTVDIAMRRRSITKEKANEIRSLLGCQK